MKVVWIVPILILLTGCQWDKDSETAAGQYFTVRVHNETFVMYVTNAETIRLAVDNFQGKNSLFPSGKITFENGGYNDPWHWHYVPDSVRMVEVSVEVCDGLPSYVDSHLTDFYSVGYCPWGGKIIRVGRY